MDLQKGERRTPAKRCPPDTHLLSCRNYRPSWCHQQSWAWWGASWVSENVVSVLCTLLTASWGQRGDRWPVGTWMQTMVLLLAQRWLTCQSSPGLQGLKSLWCDVPERPSPHPNLCGPRRAPWLLLWTLVVINGRAEAMDGPGTKQEESHKGEVWEEAWLPFSGGRGSTAMEEHVVTHIYPHSGGHQHCTDQHPEQSQDTHHNQHAVGHTGDSLFFQLPTSPTPQHWAAEDPLGAWQLQGREGGSREVWDCQD